MYYEENLCSISITIKRADEITMPIDTFHQNTQRNLDHLLDEDYDTLSSDRLRLLSHIVQQLQSNLSIENLYNGFLQLSSPKKQLKFLRLLNTEKQFDILKLLNLEHLEQGIAFLIKLNDLDRLFYKTITIPTFINILAVLPETAYNHSNYVGQLQLKFTFLDQFSKEYLQNIIKTSGNFVGILSVLPKDCWGYFLAKFDEKFLRKKINNLGDVRFILKNWSDNHLEYINNFEDRKKITNFRLFLNKKLHNQDNKKSFFKSTAHKSTKYIVSNRNTTLMFRRLSGSNSVIVVENTAQNLPPNKPPVPRLLY